MSDAGRKIIDGLKDALAGNFAAVTIGGQRWVRADAHDALVKALEKIERGATSVLLTAELNDEPIARGVLSLLLEDAREGLSLIRSEREPGREGA